MRPFDTRNEAGFLRQMKPAYTRNETGMNAK